MRPQTCPVRPLDDYNWGADGCTGGSGCEPRGVTNAACHTLMTHLNTPQKVQLFLVPIWRTMASIDQP